MSTTKETRQHKKEKPKVAPQWFKTDLGSLMKKDNFERLGKLMEEAAVALKDFQDELKKAQR